MEEPSLLRRILRYLLPSLLYIGIRAAMAWWSVAFCSNSLNLLLPDIFLAFALGTALAGKEPGKVPLLWLSFSAALLALVFFFLSILVYQQNTV